MLLLVNHHNACDITLNQVFKKIDNYRYCKHQYRQCCGSDPGSGAFLTPGSGIWNRFFPDPGSQTHSFDSLVIMFWVKSSISL
jgi:hypothetical protein